jgi:hypothetical protein
MANHAPAFQLYVRDVLADARFVVMDNFEVGVFFRLLLYLWINELPSDLTALASLLHMKPKELDAIWPKLAPMFEVAGTRLLYPPHEQQKAQHAAWREQSRRGGLASGESRRSKGGSTTKQPDDIAPVEPDGNTAICDLQSATCDLPTSSETHEPSQTRAREPGHEAHVYCGRVCVVEFIHREFIRKLNVADAADRLKSWYPLVLDRVAPEIVLEEPAKFWRWAFANYAPVLPEEYPRMRRPV